MIWNEKTAASAAVFQQAKPLLFIFASQKLNEVVSADQYPGGTENRKKHDRGLREAAKGLPDRRKYRDAFEAVKKSYSGCREIRKILAF